MWVVLRVLRSGFFFYLFWRSFWYPYVVCLNNHFFNFFFFYHSCSAEPVETWAAWEERRWINVAGASARFIAVRHVKEWIGKLGTKTSASNWRESCWAGKVSTGVAGKRRTTGINVVVVCVVCVVLVVVHVVVLVVHVKNTTQKKIIIIIKIL